MRVMLGELTRINSHLVWLGTHAMDLGAMIVFLYCFREREEILRIFEMFSGQRMMTSYFRIGGLALEPPRGWQQAVGKFIDAFPSRVDEYEELLTKNPIWMRRTQGVGRASLEDLIAHGVTGPMLRAAGLAWDIRKSEPYSSYEKFDFEIPTRTESDVYARYQVRVEELRQSARIVKQALEGMPAGPWEADAPHVVLPDREKMKTQMEALIYHFKIVTEGFRVPAGEVYQVVESPARRDWATTWSATEPRSPTACSFTAPASGTCKALPKMVEGRLVADAIAALGSDGLRVGRRGQMRSDRDVIDKHQTNTPKEVRMKDRR